MLSDCLKPDERKKGLKTITTLYSEKLKQLLLHWHTLLFPPPKKKKKIQAAGFIEKNKLTTKIVSIGAAISQISNVPIVLK